MELTSQQKRTYEVMDKYFNDNLPETLYKNHYELSGETRIPPAAWRFYLQENQHTIQSEVAAIIEASARSTLRRIGEGQMHKGEAAVVKQLLDRSEQINKQTQNKKTIISHFIPEFTPKKHQTQPKEEESVDEILRESTENVSESTEEPNQ